MIVSFFGHSNYRKNQNDEEKMLEILEQEIGDSTAELYLGGYGNFDAFALSCAKKYKKKHPTIKIIFVTPYINESYQRSKLQYIQTEYDEIIYPEIETVHPRLAIKYRNKWIIDKTDTIIFHVTKNYGGAYQAYEYAHKSNKKIIFMQ